MIQQAFINRATQIVKADNSILGLAVAGSWLTNELDEYSDVDLVLVTREKVSYSKEQMTAYARKLGNFLSGFTGEHVGEPRLLICLYKEPLLHVDIKFLSLDEFDKHVERPHIVADTDGLLQQALNNAEVKFPHPDYQWIEDRFWTWVHYLAGKIGRGEYLEALDGLGFLRMVIFGPLLHIKNGNLPRGVRKVETMLPGADLEQLTGTIATYDKASLMASLQAAIVLYNSLREALYDDDIVFNKETEGEVIIYLKGLA